MSKGGGMKNGKKDTTEFNKVYITKTNDKPEVKMIEGKGCDIEDT